MPKISVIVPVYKVEPYLRRCVDSILAQTFTDFELILVDDGSPDGCPAICDEYAMIDNRVRVIHKANGGLSDARNAGLDAAVGEFISFVDSDDWVSESYLSNLYEPEYDFATTGYIDIYKRGKRVVSHENYSSKKFDKSECQRQFAYNKLEWMHFACRHLFRKRIIEKNSLIFDVNLKTMEDTIFVVEYLSFCSSVIVKNYSDYFYCHIRQDALSKTINEKHLENLFNSDSGIAKLFAEKFDVDYHGKSSNGLPGVYVWYLGIIVGNPDFLFREQLHALRFIFSSRIYEYTIQNIDKYYCGSSKLFQYLLKLRSPFLYWLAITVKKKLSLLCDA